MTRQQVQDEWRDVFLSQARLLEVPGRLIGEALAEVETHCADSGQSPDQAFGEPAAYARTLASGLAVRPVRRALRRHLRSVLLAAAGMAGIVLLPTGAGSLAHGGPAAITAGDVVSVVAGAIAVMLIVDLALAAGRLRRTWLLVLTLVLGFAASIGPRLLWQQQLVRMPAWLALIAGLALLAAAWWPLAVQQDRVLDPRTRREPFPPRPVLLTVLRLSPLVLLALLVLLVILMPK